MNASASITNVSEKMNRFLDLNKIWPPNNLGSGSIENITIQTFIEIKSDKLRTLMFSKNFETNIIPIFANGNDNKIIASSYSVTLGNLFPI